MVFFGFVFQVFMLLWFVFGVSGIVPKVLKMFVFFPVLGGFCGVVYSCLLGFGRFRCFCGSCVWFFFCSGFVFVCFGFVSVCCWRCSCFLFSLLLFLVFCFSFFGGFKGQVRWPLNPPYFYLFRFCFLVFVFFFCFLFFVFFLFVFWRV